MATNFGDFQNEVYAEAVHGVTTRYPFDFASIERKASEALPDWVYRYVSAAAGSTDEHLYPDPDGFTVDMPMGRYTGVTEMIEMSKTPGEYKYPLTPFGSWQPSWL